MIQIAQFQFESQAKALVDELAKQAVSATCAMTRSVTKPARVAGVVRVAPEDFETAMQVVIDADLLPYSSWTGVACPQCHSLKTERVKTYFKHVPLPLFLLSLFALGLPLFFLRQPNHCLDCGHLW
ncbi:MAG: hypothetical protein KAI66_09845 [Lentisphaeria bacterium]|nr:hypothetical protein [Lentisphaeria bacterium]